MELSVINQPFSAFQGDSFWGPFFLGYVSMAQETGGGCALLLLHPWSKGFSQIVDTALSPKT